MLPCYQFQILITEAKCCTLSVWPVLYRFGLYSIGLALYSIGLALYSIGLGLYSIGLACTLSVWPVLYRFGLYSIGLACTLSVCLVLYRFASYSIGLPRTLSVWPCTLSVSFDSFMQKYVNYNNIMQQEMEITQQRMTNSYAKIQQPHISNNSVLSTTMFTNT